MNNLIVIIIFIILLYFLSSDKDLMEQIGKHKFLVLLFLIYLIYNNFNLTIILAIIIGFVIYRNKIANVAIGTDLYQQYKTRLMNQFSNINFENVFQQIQDFINNKILGEEDKI